MISILALVWTSYCESGSFIAEMYQALRWPTWCFVYAEPVVVPLG